MPKVIFPLGLDPELKRKAMQAAKDMGSDLTAQLTQFCRSLIIEEPKEVLIGVKVNTKGQIVKDPKPTVEQVKEYCDERKNGIDPESFWNFYESKGWKVGNAPMKNWKSAIITWEKRHEKEKPKERKFQSFN